VTVTASDLKGINDCLTGYDNEIPLAIYGIAKTGKTMFCIQEAFYLMSKIHKNTLFFSTEMGVKRYIEYLEPIFRKKFSTPDTCKMILIECPPQEKHLEKVAEAFGKLIHLKMGDTGKVDVQFTGSKEGEVERIIKNKNVGILIVDSLTKPFKSEEFAGVLKNLPSRATGVNIWLNAIHSMAVKYKLITFVTHHASMDPTNPYATPSMTGGSDINYDFKIQVYMQQSKSAQYSKMRWIFVVRYFNVCEWTRKCRLWIDDNGYKDVDDAFLENIREKHKADKKAREEAKKGGKAKVEVKQEDTEDDE
jgi:hypothetical protein